MFILGLVFVSAGLIWVHPGLFVIMVGLAFLVTDFVESFDAKHK